MSLGNRTGHQAPPRGGRLQALANFFSNITTIITGVILLGAVYFFIGPSWFPSLPSAPPGPEKQEGGKNAEQLPGKAQELNTEKQALAFARAKQKQAVDLGDDALRALDECVDEIQQSTTLTNSVLTNDDGKKIAGDLSLLKRFRIVYAKERPERAKVERNREVMLELVTPIKASVNNPASATMPPPGVAPEFERIQSELKSQRDAWRKDRILMEVIVSEAKRSGTAPAPRTLLESMRLAEESEALAFTLALEKETTRVRAEMNKKAIEAKAESIRLLEQAAIDKMLAEKRAEAERVRTEAFLKEENEKAAATAAKAKVERERLLAKALDPRTKQILAPILAKTIFQPVIEKSGKLRNANVGGGGDRISFTRLRTVGALDPTKEGLAALATVGCYINRQPHWLFSTTPAEWTDGKQGVPSKRLKSPLMRGWSDSGAREARPRATFARRGAGREGGKNCWIAFRKPFPQFGDFQFHCKP